MTTIISKTLTCLLILAGFVLNVQAQDYVSPTKPLPPGTAPGMKVKLLDSSATSKTYVIIFKHGDEVVSGINNFAQAHNIKCAHYTAIGDAITVKLGWFDYKRKEFKVIPVDTAEIASFTGDIAVFEGKSVAHTHVSVATQDGICHGGHLLQLYAGPTVELFVTVEPVALYKKSDPEFNAATIDLSLEK